jgi:sugar lactone lactonase YvrE
MKANTLHLLAGLVITTTAVCGKTIPNYAEANLVLGQVDFTSNLAPSTPNAPSLSDPVSVVVDPVTRKVFVAEEGNDRVLRYASADALANGAQAEAVFGQELFTTSTTAVTAHKFGGDPESIFLDAKGRLWVPDFAGSRVLRFDLAATRDSSPGADRVYGQPNFTTSTPGTTVAKMKYPYDVCVDTADRLWVADSGNNRVLRFDSITTKPSGANADAVLGQANFTTGTAGSGSNGLQFPTGVTVSASGTLYVTCNNASIMPQA